MTPHWWTRNLVEELNDNDDDVARAEILTKKEKVSEWVHPTFQFTLWALKRSAWLHF